MESCNLMSTPAKTGVKLVKDSVGKKDDNTFYRQLVGSLMYVIATRPNIMLVVSLISRFMEHSKKIHLMVVKRILPYLRGITKYGIFYKKGKNPYFLGFIDRAISWLLRKQSIVPFSTTEIEFVAPTTCACQTI
ncbi:hypothetical protein CR513_52294, partial [Mucuna pruriens]